MKPIDQMTLAECIEALQSLEEFTLLKDIDTGNFEPTYDSMKKNAVELADRIADLSRWIPVSERMPTIDDTYRMSVLWIDDHGFIIKARYEQKHDMHKWVAWKRITPPEGKP
jgi:hypothetical protein